MTESELPITTSDRVFTTLRQQIVEGVIAPSSKLSEAELSTTHGVSRAVIRETINRLQAINLVERKANIGARVITLSEKGLIEVYQVREALEGMAARLAAKNMTSVERAELQSLIAGHESMVKGGERYYQEAGDVDLHYRIVLGSHNQQLFSFLTNSIYHLVRMYRVQLGMAGPRVSTAFFEHQQIVQAICNRDEELAEMLMRRHILYSRKNIEQKLKEQT